MQHKNQGLNNHFNEISKTIDQYIEDNEQFSPDLNGIEHWLKNQFEKIRDQKLKQSHIIKEHIINENPIQDGIIIFDKSFSIHHYSGSLTNFTLSSSKQHANFNLLDFVDKSDHANLKSAILDAKNYCNNIAMDIQFITGTGIKNKCLMEFDFASSNVDNNRFVAILNFHEIHPQQLTDYQSIMFENLPGMDIYLFDRDYRYIIAGGKEKKRFNLSNNDFIGKTLFEVLDKSTQRKLFPFYNKSINGESTEGEVRYNNDVYYIMSIPVKDHMNNTVAGMLISQNVTNDKLVEEQLKKGKEEAQKANNAKSIFIANLSHEIRTPLTAIIGFTEQIEKTKLSAEQSKYISLIQKASDQLLYLVTEVVFLFKLGLGKVYIEKTPFSLTELLDELNNLFLRQAAEKNIHFIIKKDEEFPSLLIGDPYRLRQILTNLLVNAIKYTDNGQVTLTCKLKKDYKRKVELIFEVADTGVGISKIDLPYIFNVFEQGNNRTNKISGGAGLGLGICHQLVTLLKGDISVKSKLKVGSTFKVFLPFEKALGTHVIKHKNKFEIDNEYLINKKILFADDDEHNLLLAGTILKNWKTDYILVENGKQAIDELKKTKFDVILLDINMPVKNGIDVIKSIRSDVNGINYKTPALSITANAIKSDIHKYLKEGFDDYLIKPFREAGLYNKLCNILGMEPTKHPKKKSLKQQAKIRTSDVFNTTELLKTARSDQEFFNMMIDNFITNANTLVDNFEKNTVVGGWTEIGERAHKAIPSFKYFELNKLAANFEYIEDLALRDKNYDELPEIIKHTISLVHNAIQQAETVKETFKNR